MSATNSDETHVPSFCTAMPAVSREVRGGYANLVHLYVAVNHYLARRGEPTIPLGSFTRLVKKTGYALFRHGPYGVRHVRNLSLTGELPPNMNEPTRKRYS